MSGFWQQTARAATGNATVTAAAPAGGAVGGTIVRLRALQISTGAVALTAQVLDGAAVIWQEDIPAAGQNVALVALDLRASPGNALVVQFVGTNTTVPTDINAQGDYIPVGYPAFTS